MAHPLDIRSPDRKIPFPRNIRNRLLCIIDPNVGLKPTEVSDLREDFCCVAKRVVNIGGERLPGNARIVEPVSPRPLEYAFTKDCDSVCETLELADFVDVLLV